MAALILTCATLATARAQDMRGPGETRAPAGPPAPQVAPAASQSASGVAQAGDPWAALEPAWPVWHRIQTGATAAGASAGPVSADTGPRPLPRAHTGAKSGAAGAGRGEGATWLRTTASLAGVVALIVLLTWGYRQVAAGGLRWTPRARHPGLIEVLARATLSPRQSLCLVRIGPRLVLLGVTPTAVNALDVIQDPDLTARLAGAAGARRPDSQTAEFARCLEQEARGARTEEARVGQVEPPLGGLRASGVHGAAQPALLSIADEAHRASGETRRGRAGDRNAAEPGTGDLRARLAETLQRLRAASGA